MTNCAIIGIGAISAAHIEGYQAQGNNCKIVALSDINLERAQSVIEEYKLDAKAFTDYKEILSDESIHLISICTPPGLHCAIVLECLRAGKHVLLEKPMALSLQQCDEMIQVSEECGKIVSIVSQYRYTGQYYRLKKLMESGVAGKVLQTSVDALFWRGQSYYYLDWRGRWSTEGGGCTLNHAVHLIDQMLWHFGMPSKVAAFMNNLGHNNSEVEDISEAVLHYDNGLVGRITSSLIHHGEHQGIQIQTDRCGIGVPFKATASKALENGFPEPNTDTEKEIQNVFDNIKLPEHQGHAGQIFEVLKAINGEEADYVSAQDGRNALELILAIYKAASTMQVVSLPIKNDDPFYRSETRLGFMPIFNEKKISVQSFKNNKIKVGGSEYVEK